MVQEGEREWINYSVFLVWDKQQVGVRMRVGWAVSESAGVEEKNLRRWVIKEAGTEWGRGGASERAGRLDGYECHGVSAAAAQVWWMGCRHHRTADCKHLYCENAAISWLLFVVINAFLQKENQKLYNVMFTTERQQIYYSNRLFWPEILLVFFSLSRENMKRRSKKKNCPVKLTS